METFWRFLFTPSPTLKSESVILGLVNDSDFECELFRQEFDIMKPLDDVAFSLGLSEQQGRRFVEANIDSSFALACLKNFLDTLKPNQRVVIRNVVTKDQSDLIRQFGGHVVDLSTQVIHEQRIPSRVMVDAYEFTIPTCMVTAESDCILPGGSVLDVIAYLNSTSK
jgi:hypothetical protein